MHTSSAKSIELSRDQYSQLRRRWHAGEGKEVLAAEFGMTRGQLQAYAKSNGWLERKYERDSWR